MQLCQSVSVLLWESRLRHLRFRGDLRANSSPNFVTIIKQPTLAPFQAVGVPSQAKVGCVFLRAELLAQTMVLGEVASRSLSMFRNLHCRI